MRCAVIACDNQAATIYRGFALCERCWEITDSIPAIVPTGFIDHILGDVLSGDYADDEDADDNGFKQLKRVLKHRGFA